MKKILLAASVIASLHLRAQGVYDAPNNQFKITTSFGTMSMGPSGTVSNYGWCHIKTDASMFYMEKPVVSNTGIFGAYNNSDLILQTNANPNTSAGYNVTRMTILKSNGNVGIGTTAPQYLLDVNGSARLGTTTAKVAMGNHVEIGYPAATDLAGFSSVGLGVYQATSAGAGLVVQLRNTTSGAVNTQLTLKQNDQVALKVINEAYFTGMNTRFMVMGNGATYIGDKKAFGNHSDAMLSVYGKGLFKSIYVSTNASVWADYVFAKDYKLKPLSEVEAYYTANHHLPEVPSAQEVEKDQINVAEMDALLLKKIEELTLYIVKLEKDVNELKNSKNK